MPAVRTMSAENYATFAEETIKRSSHIFNAMVQHTHNIIDPRRSSIRIFHQLLTYPQTRIIIKFTPRNSFDKLPILLSPDDYESQDMYESDRKRILNDFSEKFVSEFSCDICYGDPNCGPTYKAYFEPFLDFSGSMSETYPDWMKKIRK